jgi:phosphoserine aminotransferase
MRPYNFNPGPATLPESVLQQAAHDMLDWQGSGMSVMEMSHRASHFLSIYEKALADLRELMALPPEFKILFMQGGGKGHNAFIPMNLARPDQAADFVLTGNWSEGSAKEAGKYCRSHIAAQAAPYTRIPDAATWQLEKGAAYTHICSNETVCGVEFQELPDMRALGSDAPLVVDFSSNVLSRSMDWSRVGLAFGGAQKNIGAAGVTLVLVREDLLGSAQAICPEVFDFAAQAKNDSMLNTPPTYSIYIAGLVFEWLKKQGGVAAMEQQNIAKAELLYGAIDGSALYENRVAKNCRSRMNVPFFLRDESLNAAFLEAAKNAGLLGLKGHKMVGGMRASIYNAMPLAGVQKLVAFMQHFETANYKG